MVSFSVRKIRKNIIKSNFVFFALMFAISCSDSSNTEQKIDKQKTYNWSLVTTWPKNYPGLGMAPERLAKLVKEMSDGRMNITVYGAGEIVPAMGVFDAVSSGSVQMGHSGAYYWKGKIPAAQFFAGVPFGLNAKEMNAWVNRGGGLEIWRELYEPFNIYPIPCGNTGTQMFGWFNTWIWFHIALLLFCQHLRVVVCCGSYKVISIEHNVVMFMIYILRSIVTCLLSI